MAAAAAARLVSAAGQALVMLEGKEGVSCGHRVVLEGKEMRFLVILGGRKGCSLVVVEGKKGCFLVILEGNEGIPLFYQKGMRVFPCYIGREWGAHLLSTRASRCLAP